MNSRHEKTFFNNFYQENTTVTRYKNCDYFASGIFDFGICNLAQGMTGISEVPLTRNPGSST